LKLPFRHPQSVLHMFSMEVFLLLFVQAAGIREFEGWDWHELWSLPFAGFQHSSAMTVPVLFMVNPRLTTMPEVLTSLPLSPVFLSLIGSSAH